MSIPQGTNFRSRRKSKRRMFKRRRYPSARSNKRSIQKIRRLFELKDLGVDLTNAGAAPINPTTTPIFQNILTMAQGSANGTRVGDRITVTSVHWSFEVNLNPAGGSASQTVRFILLWDRQANGAGLATTNTLFQDNVATASILTPFDTNNIMKPGRFKILANEFITVNSGGFNSVTNLPIVSAVVSHGKRKVNREVKFDQDVSTSVPIVNSLIAVWLSDQAANGPIVNTIYKVVYKDA